MSMTESATAVVSTIDPSWAAIGSLLLTSLIFPFVTYYFKKNERLHEETKTKVSDHSITLGLHEYRLISLEEWRKYQTGTIPAPPSTVQVTH